MKQYWITRFEDYYETLKNRLGDKFKEPSFGKGIQLDSCQAWIVRDNANDTTCLQSYSTIVSVKFPEDKKVIRLGKWSHTTSRHQGRFDIMYNAAEAK